MYMIQSMPTQHFRNPFLKLLETLVTTRSIYLQEEKNPTSINAVMANCSVMSAIRSGCFLVYCNSFIGGAYRHCVVFRVFPPSVLFAEIGSNDQYHCFAISLFKLLPAKAIGTRRLKSEQYIVLAAPP